ncbi:hypothetical protein SAMD00019534_007330, partial [Acytostelium subglobosum LB1]|uniref:hypothetical protein n=1 Tax=Acytostelium subglobosum LB1 TaxID=1410327 RepID=UPI000644B84D
MKYKSTRGTVNGLSFIDAVKMGLADDGGLLVPESVPQVSQQMLDQWRSQSFQEISFNILSMYIDRSEIPENDLRDLVNRSYATFSNDAVTPLKRLDENNNTFILELFHGPTFSFKDVALQFLGNLFEYILKRDNERLSVVVATSGDTGSAAIHGLKGRENINLFVLYPAGRISAVQELQMTTVLDHNVHPLCISDCTFDDCQSAVKTIMSDLTFKKAHNLGAVNSINWARILAQMVYYFYAYFRVQDILGEGKSVTFSVPTGNFGDILAGFYARKMGLPVNNLIVSTNQNDILYRFFSTGEYSKPNTVIPTVAPAMDINVASNFERYLYYLCKEDPAQLVNLMHTFNTTGRFSMSREQMNSVSVNDGFVSSSVGHQEILDTIAEYHKQLNYLMDPHTAVGVAGAKAHGLCTLTNYANLSRPADALVCLSTAHPAKFGDTVKEATKGQVDIENQFEPTKQLLQQQSTTSKLNKIDLKLDVNQIRDYVSSQLGAKCCNNTHP